MEGKRLEDVFYDYIKIKEAVQMIEDGTAQVVLQYQYDKDKEIVYLDELLDQDEEPFTEIIKDALESKLASMRAEIKEII